MDLHPAVQQLAFLLGTWRGQGKGEYPTIEPFHYLEEIEFWHVGKPFLAYRQKTRHPETHLPMHSEVGYWRAVGPGRVEIVLAHPTGIAEIQEGTVEGTTVDVASTGVIRTSTAKDVARLERTFVVEGDVLRYDVRMAAVGVPMTHHLSADLLRAQD